MFAMSRATLGFSAMQTIKIVWSEG